ncbi:hypothetical protein V1517DRAFT_316162 [Lipomyces orientalis]|uniref:Uncharacterized protein n=1 Tax=Lipomyces orientalis TaxID=1233043 RepID=A0ACC3TUV8_9ASCO
MLTIILVSANQLYHMACILLMQTSLDHLNFRNRIHPCFGMQIRSVLFLLAIHTSNIYVFTLYRRRTNVL